MGEDDVKLFKCHVYDGIAQNCPRAFKGTIVEIPVSSDINYDWSHRNLESGRRNGHAAAQAIFAEYMEKGGPQPHGTLRIIGEDLRIKRIKEITEARRAEYSRC